MYKNRMSKKGSPIAVDTYGTGFCESSGVHLWEYLYRNREADESPLVLKLPQGLGFWDYGWRCFVIHDHSRLLLTLATVVPGELKHAIIETLS